MKQILLFIALLITMLLNAQTEAEKAKNELDKFGELVVNIQISDQSMAKDFVNTMSVFAKNGNSVLAYMNKEEYADFLNMNLPYSVIPKTKSLNSTVVTTVEEMSNWDKYPSYDLFVAMMYQFQTDYPEICKVENIGDSYDGREILIAKISDNVNQEEDEPEYLYTAQMHGNEIMTYILLLRYIDYLLTNYNTDAQVTELVNNIEIWINPLANPDGTYAGGNTNVSNATRSNAQSKDLNRNYTNIGSGEEPYTIATETEVFKEFAESRDFVMSANIHTGYEVVNYPWDIWTTNDPYGFGYEIRPHADDNWWQYVSAIYANKAQLEGPANGLNNYLKDFDSGYTEGGDWSVVEGSRMDYITYYTNCRETTLELQGAVNGTGDFILEDSELPKYWAANKQALLDYMQEVLYGFRGIVTDEISGNPIAAKVEIVGHDSDNSHVYSALPVGNYHRPIYGGVYNVTFSAEGYHSKIIEITATNNDITVENVSLIPVNISVSAYDSKNIVNVYPVPSSGTVYVEHIEDYASLQVLNVLGRVVYSVNLTNTSVELNLSGLSKGVYTIKLTSDKSELKKKLILK